MSFHITTFPLPNTLYLGALRQARKLMNAGDVIRMFDGPFSDAVILGFDKVGECKVSRPYAYANSVGSVPTVLLGTETWTLTYANLKAIIEKYGVIDEGRTTT